MAKSLRSALRPRRPLFPRRAIIASQSGWRRVKEAVGGAVRGFGARGFQDLSFRATAGHLATSWPCHAVIVPKARQAATHDRHQRDRFWMCVEAVTGR